MARNTLDDFTKEELKKIGSSPTAIASKNPKRDPQRRGSVKKYKKALTVSPAELDKAVHDSHNEARKAKRELDSDELSARSRLFPSSGWWEFIGAPVLEAFTELFWHGRSPITNAAKILAAAGVIAGTMFFPFAAFIAPAAAFFQSALGLATVAAIAIVAGRVAFGLTGLLFKKMFKVEEQYLPTRVVDIWNEQYGMEENTLKAMNRYLINVENKLESKQLKHRIKQLRELELNMVVSGSPAKLSKFFSEEFRMLHEDKARLQKASEEDRFSGEDSAEYQAKINQFHLDIDAVRAILTDLSTIDTLPESIEQEIEEALKLDSESLSQEAQTYDDAGQYLEEKQRKFTSAYETEYSRTLTRKLEKTGSQSNEPNPGSSPNHNNKK